jgi:hypothetical protein
MDKPVVSLNVATRSCNVYPDKRWFAVLCRFWLRCSRTLGRMSAAAGLLRLWVRIPPVAWIFVCCESCVMSGRGLCDELITHPEESYRLWCVVVCDLQTSWMKRPCPTGGGVRAIVPKTNKQTNTERWSVVQPLPIKCFLFLIHRHITLFRLYKILIIWYKTTRIFIARVHKIR